jgi:stage III sporulation protein AH
MKNIFKKNQIIITALAIMIAIAGYLNFSQRNNEDIPANEVIDYDTYSETQSDDLSDSSVMSLDDTQDLLDESALDITTDGETSEDALAEDGNSTEDTAKADDVSKEDNSTEAADADTLEETAQLGVSDTGEVVADNDENTSTPGEAVLVSTTTASDYFSSRKLAREQLRAQNKETLMEVIDNASLSEKEKEDAVSKILDMTAISEKENATETLLEAKGFSDAIVTIEGGDVDVVVNAVSLTEQDVAQIEDIVKRKTGAKSEDIVISPVVANE